MQNEGNIHSLRRQQVLTIKEADFLAIVFKPITAKDVEYLLKCSESTARRRIREYRQAKNLTNKRLITYAGFMHFHTGDEVFIIEKDEQTHLKRA